MSHKERQMLAAIVAASDSGKSYQVSGLTEFQIVTKLRVHGYAETDGSYSGFTYWLPTAKGKLAINGIGTR